MKKKRPLEEKVLAEVKKRVAQIEETLKPALENSSFSSNTTKEAEQTAYAVAKVRTQLFDFFFLLWNASRMFGWIAMKSGTDSFLNK